MATASASTSTSRTANGATPADVEKQLDTLRDDISALTQQVSDLVNQTKDDTMAQVKEQAKRAKAAISDVQETGREAVDAFRDVADTFGDAIDDSLKRRPYATLAMVAGVGFLLGAIWKR